MAMVACSVVTGPNAGAIPNGYMGYTVPTANSEPMQIVAGDSGDFWFTEYNGTNDVGKRVGRITTSGVITEFPVDTVRPNAIAFGPDGNVWFGGNGATISKMTTAGVVTDYTVPSDPSAITSITVGPDDNLWFTMNARTSGDATIGRITTSGVITQFTTGGIYTNGNTKYITTGPDGNLWFTYGGFQIGRITPTGTVTNFTVNNTDLLGDITTGPDGNLWFTNYSGDKVGRITTSGVITQYTVPVKGGGPSSIVTGPDGNLWFTMYEKHKIGRITPAGEVTYDSLPIFSYPAYLTNGSGNTLWLTETGVTHQAGNRITKFTVDIASSANTAVTYSDSQPSTDVRVVGNQTVVLDGVRGVTTVDAGGTLKGTGTTDNLTISTDAIVAPGHSPGKLTVVQDLVLASGSTYQAELLNASTYDKIQVGGNVDVSGAILDLQFVAGGKVNQGETFTIIDNQGANPVTGTFAGLAEGGRITIGNAIFAISYVGGTGNDVVLTALTAADAPLTPNTGFHLVTANPAIALMLGLAAAVTLIVAKRRFSHK